MSDLIVQEPENQAVQTMQLLQQAVQAGTSPEALEKLVALQERILARNAEGEFAVAMAQFQSRCPAIAKRKAVHNRSGQRMYAYAPLEDIISQVKDLMVELGFSYAFDTEHLDSGGVEVSCIVRHRGGHKETTRVYIPATKGMNTNAAQDQIIQVTYGRRQSFVNAFGITTADEDSDGNSESRHAPITATQLAELEQMVTNTETDMVKFCKHLRVESLDQLPAGRYEAAMEALQTKARRARGEE